MAEIVRHLGVNTSSITRTIAKLEKRVGDSYAPSEPTSLFAFWPVAIKSPSDVTITLPYSSGLSSGMYHVKRPDPDANIGNQFDISRKGLYTVTIKALSGTRLSDPVQGVLNVEF